MPENRQAKIQPQSALINPMSTDPFYQKFPKKIARHYYKYGWDRYWNWIRRVCARKSGVLVYVGMHKGDSFARIFNRYETCYGFEADPELYARLSRRFRCVAGTKGGVHIHNCAVADHDGEVTFNIFVGGRGCSSIGNLSADYYNQSAPPKNIKTITVPSINLGNFLRDKNVQIIDHYISDIQGMDLQVLKTLKPWIDDGRIKNIQCEVSLDALGKLYDGLPDNSESGFAKLLGENYECVGIARRGRWCYRADAESTDYERERVEQPIAWDADYFWRLKTGKSLSG